MPDFISMLEQMQARNRRGPSIYDSSRPSQQGPRSAFSAPPQTQANAPLNTSAWGGPYQNLNWSGSWNPAAPQPFVTPQRQQQPLSSPGSLQRRIASQITGQGSPFGLPLEEAGIDTNSVGSPMSSDETVRRWGIRNEVPPAPPVPSARLPIADRTANRQTNDAFSAPPQSAAMPNPAGTFQIGDAVSDQAASATNPFAPTGGDFPSFGGTQLPLASPTNPFNVNVYNGDEQSQTTYTPNGSGGFSGQSNATPSSQSLTRDQFINRELARGPMGVMLVNSPMGRLPFQTTNGQVMRDASAAWSAQQQNDRLSDNSTAQLGIQRDSLAIQRQQEERLRQEAGRLAAQQRAGMVAALVAQGTDEQDAQRLVDRNMPASPFNAPPTGAAMPNPAAPGGAAPQQQQQAGTIPGRNPVWHSIRQQLEAAQAPGPGRSATASIGEMLNRLDTSHSPGFVEQNWPAIEAYLRSRGNSDFETAALGSGWEFLPGMNPLQVMPWANPSEEQQGLSMLRNLMRSRGQQLRGETPGVIPSQRRLF